MGSSAAEVIIFLPTTEMHRRTGYHVEDIYAAFKNWPVEGDFRRQDVI